MNDYPSLALSSIAQPSESVSTKGIKSYQKMDVNQSVSSGTNVSVDITVSGVTDYENCIILGPAPPYTKANYWGPGVPSRMRFTSNTNIQLLFPYSNGVNLQIGFNILEFEADSVLSTQLVSDSWACTGAYVNLDHDTTITTVTDSGLCILNIPWFLIGQYQRNTSNGNIGVANKFSFPDTSNVRCNYYDAGVGTFYADYRIIEVAV